MNYYGFSSLFNGIVVLAVGFYLLSRQRQNALYQSFAIFSASVGLWCVFYALWQSQTQKAEAFLWIRVAMAFCYTIPFAFLWFAMKLTGLSYRSWHPVALLATPLFFVAFSFSPLMIKDISTALDFDFWPRPGPLMHFFVLIFFVLVLISYGVLWRGYGAARDTQRWQIKWVSLSILPGWIGGITNWCLWYDIPVPPVAHIFVGVAFLLLFYAIIRGRLFDISTLADAIQTAKLTALGVIAASINHEIRNPLYVIKGLAETLAERAADPLADKEQVLAKVRELSEKTIAQSDRALGIIKSFSAYARRETDKVYEKQRVRVKSVLEHILPFVESELSLRKVSILQDIPEDLEVVADVQSLEEIFINLIVNACQAIKETGKPGEIKVTAEMTQDQHPVLREFQHRVLIRVSDTGPGLTPEQIFHIFEPFYTTKAEGTGVGLYVVKQLVERNGGRILVNSSPKNFGRIRQGGVAEKASSGAIFTIFLPLEKPI